MRPHTKLHGDGLDLYKHPPAPPDFCKINTDFIHSETVLHTVRLSYAQSIWDLDN